MIEYAHGIVDAKNLQMIVRFDTKKLKFGWALECGMLELCEDGVILLYGNCVTVYVFY